MRGSHAPWTDSGYGLSRRHFLARYVGFGGRVLGGALACSLLNPQAAYAFLDPATAAGLLQAVAGIARLMQRSGPSEVDLLNLQVEMLKNVQTELGVIQSGIQMILARLDDLEQLILRIPDNTAIGLYRDQVLARQGDYVELMKTYQDIVSSSGIQAARDRVVGELTNAVLVPLRRTRSELMTHYQIGVIPMVCTAAFVEIATAIMVGEANNNKARTLEAIQRYEDWLRKVRTGPMDLSLDQAIADASQKQTKLRQDAALDQKYDCSDRQTFPRDFSCYGFDLIVTTCSSANVEAKLHRIRDAKVAASVREMLANGYLTIVDVPVTVDLSVTSTSPETVNTDCSNGNPLRNQRHDCPGTALALSCSARRTELLAKAADLSQKLSLGGLSLVSLKALGVASDAGLAFLAKMRSAIAAH